MSSQVLILRDRILELQDQAIAIQKEKDALREQLHKECDHPIILECPYSLESAYVNASPDHRVCLICGIDDEGWGRGSGLLYRNVEGREVRAVTRDEIWKFKHRLHPLRTTYTA